MPKKNRGIHIWFRKERDCWEVGEFVNGNRKRHATGFSCRSEAEKALAEVILLSQTPKRLSDDYTLGELIAYYIEEHVPSLANPKTALVCFEHLLPFWGGLRLEDIRQSRCRDYLVFRKRAFVKWQQAHGYKTERTLSEETVRRELEQLQAAIRYAHKDNLITYFPAVWKPKKCKPKSRWLTPREAARLIREARRLEKSSAYLPLFILLALYTGARSEAVLTLKWSQVDLDNQVIDFRGGQISQNKGRSIIPIPKRLLRELEVAQCLAMPNGYVIHRERTVKEDGVIKRGQFPIGSVKKSFGLACERAGLKDVTPHTLRHTAASWMVQKGVPIYDVAKYLGHSSIAMVEKTYGHMAPEHLQRAKESWG